MDLATPVRRRDELRANLTAVRERVARAAAASGRDCDELTLIVVTKTFPAADVQMLADLGVTDVGESRDQEAAAKVAACAGLALRWHFVGQVQRNKARSVASYAALVHTVDRAPLVTALSRAREQHDPQQAPPLPVLVQVSLDPAPGAGGRAGVAPEKALELADTVEAAPRLQLAGLMGVAPLAADPAPAFARLARVAERVRQAHPRARIVSAGMSGDLEAAIAAGATHLRIGSAILGARAPAR